jgi:hypothetical protein
MISLDQHATERHHALKREQKNWLTPQKLLMNPNDDKITFDYLVCGEGKSNGGTVLRTHLIDASIESETRLQPGTALGCSLTNKSRILTTFG